ncbi:MAG: two-component regulator propeller domain-containing protein [Spirosomataceae bacterium]
MLFAFQFFWNIIQRAVSQKSRTLNGLLGACVFFLSLNSYAALQDELDQLSVNQGLSQSEVRCVLKDSKGYMWLGTQDGLNRFDGYDFRKFSRNSFEEKSLSSEDINCLFEDSKQRLWVGTKAGLNIKRQGGFVRLVNLFGRGFEANYVTSITEDNQHNQWVGTLGGLWVLNYTANKPTVKALALPDKEPGVIRLARDESGEVWLAKHNKLYRGGQLSTIAFEAKDQIIRLFADQKGTIWLVTREHLYRYSLKNNTIQDITPDLHLNGELLTSVFVDRYQVVWIGTATKGIHCYQVGANAALSFLKNIKVFEDGDDEKNNKTILTIYESNDPQEDVIWIGTAESGVFKYCRSKNGFRHWQELLQHENTRSKSFHSIWKDQNHQLWVGTLNGLFKIDTKKGVYKKYIFDTQNRFKNRIQSIIKDHTGQLWVASDEGLWQYDAVNQKFKAYSLPPNDQHHQPLILKLYEDTKHRFWVGTVGYLWMRDEKGQQHTWKTFHIGSKQVEIQAVSDMKQDGSGNYWFATSIGLFIQKPDGSVQQYVYEPTNREGLPDNLVLNVILDTNKVAWICTPKGISKAIWKNSRLVFRHFNEKNGLSNSFVYGGVTDADGMIWVSTNRGISRFDPHTETFHNFDANDGLSINEFNSGAFHRASDGEIFFGGLGGLISFYPSKALQNQHLSQTVLASFRIFGEELDLDSLGNKVVLDYDQNFFSIRLAALDYTNALKNEYAYRLIGFHENWILAKQQRDISFTNLPHGEYELQIKSANNQGVWNEKQILKVTILIKPSFWQTWWFYWMALLMVVGIIALLYRIRVQIKVKHLVELERVKLEENEKVKKLAAQDMHDEFGNSLTRISLLTELVKNKIKHQNEEEATALLTKIADNANRLYQGTKDFIWSISPEHDNLYEVAVRIKDYGEEVIDKSQIRFHCDGIHEELRSLVFNPGISRHLVMIFKEAITNTLKYANASEVSLDISLNPEGFQLIWKDNGKGIGTVQGKGQGIQNMKSRAEKIKAELEISSASQKGTQIKLTLT